MVKQLLGFCDIVVKVLSKAMSLDVVARMGCTNALFVLVDDTVTRSMLHERRAARMFSRVSEKFDIGVPCQCLGRILKQMLSKPPCKSGLDGVSQGLSGSVKKRHGCPNVLLLASVHPRAHVSSFFQGSQEVRGLQVFLLLQVSAL